MMLLLSFILYISASAFAQCDKVYIKPERKAEFEGGAAAWKRYIERKILPMFDTTFNEDLPYSSTLRFEFIIDTSGKISEFTFLDKYNNKEKYLNDIKAELKKIRWIPAILNGRKVCYKHIQSIILCFR